MRRVTGIAISDPDGGALVRAEFGGDGLLALAAGRSGLAGGGPRFVLTGSPDQDALVYAVFVRRRGTACALSARSDVSFPGGRKCRMAHGCGFYIGSARFSVSVERRSRGAKRVVAAAIAVTAAAFLTCASVRFLAHEKSPGRPEVDSPAPEAVAETRDVDDLAREVSAHMKSGRTEQARLAVIEHIEMNGESEGARSMLASLDRVSRRDESGSIEDAASARRLYEEGLKLMREGDFREALVRFRKASELFPFDRGDLSLRSLIDKAWSDAAVRYKAELGSHISSFEELLNGGVDENPSDATVRLLAGYGECEGIARLLGRDEEVSSLYGRLKAALEDSAGRWLAATQAAELYSGCKRAIDDYRMIVSVLERVLPHVSAEARRALEACEGGDDA
jgi:tetratricopeptide (TPR) repeat protein